MVNPDVNYPIRLPYDAYEAADKVLKALEAANNNNHAQ